MNSTRTTPCSGPGRGIRGAAGSGASIWQTTKPRFSLGRAAAIAAAGLHFIAFASADEFIEEFSGTAVDLATWRPYPAWELTEAGTLLATDDPAQKNKHISTIDTWKLESLEIRLRMASSDVPGSNVRLDIFDPGGAAVALQHIGAGAVVMSKPDQAAAYAKLPFIARPRDGQAWETWEVRREGDEFAVLLDGEVAGMVPATNMTGAATWRLITYRAELEVDRVAVRGIRIPERPPRIGTPLAEQNYAERSEGRFYAAGITAIDGPVNDVDPAPAGNLPAVEKWMVGEPDFQWDEFSEDNERFVGDRAAVVHVGRDGPKALPWRLRTFERKNEPESAKFYFNLAKDGVYTVQFYVAGAKNLANVIHLTLDGHRLMSDVIRGANPKYLHSIYREHFPVRLKAGPHVLEARMEARQSSSLSYMHGVAFDAVGLAPGNVPLVYETALDRQPALNEVITPVTAKRLIGRDFHFRIADVPAGIFDVEMTFHQPVTDSPGFAVFDVSANGTPVIEDLDIAAEGGWNEPLVRRFPVEPQDGLIDLHFEAETGRALVNQVRLLRDDTEVARYNFGTSPARNYGFRGTSDVQSKWTDPGPYTPTYGAEYPDLLPHLQTSLYDGPVNLVANPGFEYGTSLAESWRPIPDLTPSLARADVRGTGTAALDAAVHRSGEHALRIGGTSGGWGLQANSALIDWTRPYRFSGWVKADRASGETYLEITWSKPDGKGRRDGRDFYLWHGSGLSRGGVIPCGTARSQAVNGSFDWQPIEVRAYPPRGATVATFRLRSDDNTGRAWFDDLRCEGYGDLPCEIAIHPAGYHPHGSKTALVITPGPLADPVLALVDADGREVAGAESVAGAPYTMLGRHVYRFDFSGFQREGEYRLALRATGIEPMTSAPFRIRRDLYADLLKHAAFYFYIMRTGTEIPGYHQACHLDDALVASSFFDRMTRLERHRDLTGGWLDAGDYGKFHLRMIQPLYSLARVAAAGAFPWRQYGGATGDLLSETIWGADYMLKTDLGNGLLCGKVNGGFAGGGPAFPPSLETDQDPLTMDGAGRTAAWMTGEDATPALAMAQAALACGDTAPERAAAYIALAAKNYRSCTLYWDRSVSKDTPGWKQLVFQPRALWAACLLHRATGDPAYREDARRRVAVLLPLLRADLYRDSRYFWGQGQVIKGNNFPWDYLHALMEFGETFPGDPAATDCRREAQRIVGEWVLPHTTFRANPFGVIEHLMSSDLWYYPEANYTTEFFAKTAFVLARAANLYGRPEWLPAAERNLQWMTGFNHLQASYVLGMGERQFAGWSGLIHVPGLEHGIFPGAITKGPSWGYGKIDWEGRHGPKGYGMPPGFGMSTIHDGGGFYPHAPTAGIEVWEQFNGAVMTACLELNKALSPEEDGSKLTALPLGTTNLLANPGFEETESAARVRTKRPKWDVVGDAIPTHWDFNGDQAGRVTLLHDPGEARFGERVLKIEKRDDDRSASLIAGASYRETIAVAPGETYWVSVWVRGTGRIRVFAAEHGAKGYLYARDLCDYRLGPEWDRIDMAYRVPEQAGPNKETPTKVRFTLHLAPRGVVYVDNFEARRTPAIDVPRTRRLE